MTPPESRPLKGPDAGRLVVKEAVTRTADQSAAGSGEPTFTIGALASEFALTPRAIRFYEARGLITPGRSGQNRVYSRRDRARLQLILRGKNLGFSIEEIGEYLALYDADPTQRLQTAVLVSKLETRIAKLEAQRADLDRSLADLASIRAQCLAHLKGDG
jgi:DNA-binding transcriptional MerR regulator